MEYAEMISLALAALNASLKLVAELKAQSGMTDAQLLDIAKQNGVELRGDIAQYIASV